MKRFSSITLFIGLVVTIAVLLGGLLGNIDPVTAGVTSTQIDIVGPPGSGQFGDSVAALPNGNIVVTDPAYDNGLTADVGAVYLYDGATLSLISTLTGSTAGDQVGSGGVVALENGNYVVLSPDWDNGGAVDAGAATWGNGTTGIIGAVSVSNSLVGSTANDQVGSDGVVALENGNYVVSSPYWDGAVTNLGAVTWGDGMTGITGLVNTSNSLVGSTTNDRIGAMGVTALANGNYVILSRYWNNGGAANAGAATWENGSGSVTGTVSASNSLVGSTADDWIGMNVIVLANGNYVVGSPSCDNGGAADAGAATWGNGTTGITGAVSASNSLVGDTSSDRISYYGVKTLSNGNYVVSSSLWNNGVISQAGAATWGNGTSGIRGVVDVSNSLVGGALSDQVGQSIIGLINGHYVVFSPYWDNGGITDAGAATWGNGTLGVTGTITAENSVLGTVAGGGFGMVFAYDYTNNQLAVGRSVENLVTLFKSRFRLSMPLVLRN